MIDKVLDLKRLGSVLRIFRQQKRISQENLAELAEVHRTYVGGIERGERNPSFLSLNRILVALDINWTEFGKALDREKRASR